MSKRRALVTGGAGFIGSHLVDRLVREGYETIVVDSLASGRRDQVNRAAAFHDMDVASPRLAKLFRDERPEIVFHLAAQTSVIRSIQRPDADAKANVLGSINVLQRCIQSGVERVVVSSTGGALYGEPKRLPCGEAHPVRPLSPYGASKFATEVYTECLAGPGGLRYTILRYGNVYGPRQDPHGEAGVVAIFAERMLRRAEVVIFGDGRQERDFVYVDDVVEANMRALGQAKSDVYNIGTGEGASVNAIFDGLARLTGYGRRPTYAPARQGEVYKVYLDVAKARRTLGWTPRVGLDEGLARTVDYLRERTGRSS